MLFRIKLILIGLILLLFISGCTSSPNPDTQRYTERTPVFSMSKFFDGQLCAKGLVRNRNESVSRKFIAEILATSYHDQVRLDEVFVFNDGEKQTRIWQFTKKNDLWLGQAGDVVGQAVGKTIGDSLHLNYQLEVTLEDGDKIILDMDDWLHLVDETTLMGSTDMSKWGFNVGKIDIVIQKNACQQNLSIKS